MNRFEDINREIFDEDGHINRDIAEKLFENEDLLTLILEGVNEETFNKVKLIVDKVSQYR